MKKILKAANVADAEEAVKAIKTFDEAEWDKVVIYYMNHFSFYLISLFQVRLQYWEEAQRFKCEQVRWIACLLVMTETTYLAYASQDKVFHFTYRSCVY